MKKKNNPKLKSVANTDVHATREDFEFEQAEIAWLEEQRKSGENFAKEMKNLTKSELIELLKEARDEAEQFSSWLLSQNWGINEVRNEFERIKNQKKIIQENQKAGRQKQALEKMAQKPEAQSLGVDDFYGLIREAITIFNQTPLDQRIEKTEIANIRKIIVDLLCQPIYSQHSYQRDKWIDLVKRNVTSQHIDRAKKKFKNINI
jgi:hypothetical protein